MATLGDISLTELADGTKAGSAAAFLLTKPPRASAVNRNLVDGEAEVRIGLPYVVVRFCSSIRGSELLNLAIIAADQMLDLLAALDNDVLSVNRPLQQHTLVFLRDGEQVLKEVATSDWPVHVSSKVIITDRDGRSVTALPPVPPNWSKTFRYYRVSLLTSDLFEAYRNLYLALESILSVIAPKSKKEGERDWLERALDHAGTRTDMSRFGTAGRSASKSIIATQYEAIRVKIFHAKDGASILPQQPDAYRLVAEAYRSLLQIWDVIAKAWLPLNRLSGVMTYAGFAITMANAIGNAKMVLTSDLTTATQSDEVVSPDGQPIINFASTQYLGETRPGTVALHASLDVASLPNHRAVGRVAIVVDDEIPSLSGAFKVG